jgi:mannose-1-phosphate guanylyltransferase
MNDHYYALIMAGGGGTRLWPVSRRSRPKQMIRLFDERSLFQNSVERLEGLFPPDRIWIVTISDQADDLQRQCPQLPKENFILEPMPRGTASAVGLAATRLAQKDPDAVMAVLTSDHYIRNITLFHKLLLTGREAAEDNYLVTLGISPTSPSTGYGYIKFGSVLGVYRDVRVFHSAGFIEKPDQSTAEQFLSSGNYAWNSGMFIWRANRFLEETARQMPVLYRGLKEIINVSGSSSDLETIRSIWENLKPQTIDYGIMEGAEKAAVIPAESLGWNDVGSWESMFEVLPVDENGNIFVNSDSLHLDTKDTLVFDTSHQRLIVTIGIEDLMIVETEDVLLICRRDEGQNVREAVDRLTAVDRTDIL